MSKYFIIGLLFLTNLTLSISVYVRICNHGVYFAKCYLQSELFVDYDYQTFQYETDLFPIFQCSKLEIPMNAIWNRLECKALIFIAMYQTIFTHEFSSDLLNSCYTVTGTTLNPSWSQTPCN